MDPSPGFVWRFLAHVILLSRAFDDLGEISLAVYRIQSISVQFASRAQKENDSLVHCVSIVLLGSDVRHLVCSQQFLELDVSNCADARIGCKIVVAAVFL
jgi:hypothetical protein